MLGGSSPTLEADNSEYGAALAMLNGASARVRVAKVTPTKVGLFVAVWRRSASGSTEPFPADDPAQTLVVVARESGNFGAFVFDRAALVSHGIVSIAGVGGKRGFRVYPPWSHTISVQARRTQEWQCDHFVDLREGLRASS